MNLSQLKEYSGYAVIDRYNSYTFESLAKQIDDFQTFLNNELSVGDVVVVDADYHFYSIALLLALSTSSNIVIPIVRTTDEEFDAKLKASEAGKIISFDGQFNLQIQTLHTDKPTYKGYIDIVSDNKSGIVLFSSGTTGVPKVMVQDFSKLIEGFKPPRRQKNLRFLLFLMFDHIGGLNTLLGCLNNGSTCVIPSDRNPGSILNLIEKERVQVLPTSPTFLNLLLMVENFGKRDLSSLKLITYGTERMPEELLKKLHQLLPKIKLLQTFGTSETGILKTQSKSSSSLYFKIVDEDVDYKIENGELFIKSKTTVPGYKGQNSDKFTEDGWFATGDLVDVDSEGYLKVIGRINDVINVGGLKVMPTEVEDVINTVEHVIDATVFSKNNAITGQMVCAHVVIDKQAENSEVKSEIKKTCREKLDKYKRPVKITFSKEIGATSRFKKAIK